MRKLSFWCLALANTRLPGWGECARVRWCLISEFDGVFERRRRSAPRRLGTAEGSGERVESFPRALGRGPAVGRCGQGFARACRWMIVLLLRNAMSGPCHLQPCFRTLPAPIPGSHARFFHALGEKKGVEKKWPIRRPRALQTKYLPSGQHPPHHYARCSHSDLFRADVWLTHRLGLGLAST
jgi:hypothetical protein